MRRILVLLALASCALYLGATYATLGALPYPLDDAWIHLTFARNLALRHEFAFLPGQPSAGSTSPLWTFLLAPGFWLPFGIDVWVALLGVALLASGAWLTARLCRRLFPDAPRVAAVSALAFALEWHLNWAAFSGMETLFFIVLLLLMLDAYLAHKPSWWVGFLGGLSVVTRPEGAGLFALIVAHWLLTNGYWRLRVRAWKQQVGDRTRTPMQGWRLGFGVWDLPLLLFDFAVPILPYLWFNWQTSGLLLPNTFYAKQAEYAAVFANTSLLERIVNLANVTFVGPQVLLVPGFLVATWLIVRERRGGAALLLAWWLLVPIAYALRLPVGYQHGRYEMPVIPALIVLGVWGTWRLYQRLPQGALARVVSRAGTLTFALLLVAFWLIGAQRRATDAALMDCLVLQPTRWLAANTQPSDVIAAHDIGALGYYLNERPLLDLAGLITPDVILFVRDEPRLMQFLLDRNARYLVTSAAWHPNLIQDPRVQAVFHGDCPLARREGGYETGIYRVAPK